MQRTYRATLGPRPLDLSAVEPDPKRQARLAKLIERHVHGPTALHGRAPGVVDLMGLLRAAHDLYGCLTRPLAEYLARVCELYTGQVYSTASFYSDLYLDPQGRHLVKVCTGTTCHVRGAGRLARAVARAVGAAPGETDESGTFTVFTTSCVGACSLAPVLQVNGDLYGDPRHDRLPGILDAYRSPA
jgi:NADH-quinone oxidoreductase subunit E